MREVFWKEDSFEASYEHYNESVFVHCIVHKWNKTTFIKIAAVLEVFEEECVENNIFQINVVAKATDKKLIKFSKMLGFVENNGYLNNLVLSKLLEK